MGIYIWTNGRILYGQYKNDKSNGYGIEKYQNKDNYIGHYKNGYRHGLGKYKFFNKGNLEYGLYEEGKDIKTFTEEEVSEIEKGNLDVRVFFKNPNNKNEEIRLSFKVPDLDLFKDKLDQIKKEFGL
jgi:hypothetical protein